MNNAVVLGFSVVFAALAVAGCSGAEERKARYLEKGAEYFEDRNFEKARVELRNALQIDPTDAEARYHLGRVSEKLNNPREAVGHYQAAIDAEPKHMAARAALARLFLLGGLPDKAMELAEPGLTEEPQNAQLLTVRGAAKAQLGDVPGAFEDGEAALAIAPADEYAIALVASLYRQNARSDKAIEVVRAGIEQLPKSTDLRVVLAELELSHQNYEEAEAQLEKVIEIEPDQLPHRYRLARFYASTKNFPAAERTLREAIEANPQSIEAKVTLVDLMVTQKGPDAARAQLEAFASQDADNSQLQLALARFHETQGKADAAAAVYREIIEAQELKPDGLHARNRLAALLIKQNDVEAASRLIDEVLKENARDNDALAMRGNLALVRGDAPAAIADLRSVLRDQPNSLPVMRTLARAHLQNNEVALAEETLRSAAQANPADRSIRLDLSQLLLQAGRPEQAKPVLEQLIEETPADTGALETLFRTQAALKDVAAARGTAERIKRVRPDLPIGSYLEGVINESEGKLDAARAAYERALELQPAAAEPLTALIRVDVAQKRGDRALARINEVIAAQPDNMVARNLKGELLTARGEIDEAISAFRDAIEKSPEWWMPYKGLALAQVSGKRSQEAIETLTLGAQKTGSATLTMELAALHERMGKVDEAIRAYEGLLEREPQSVAALNNLAMLLVSYRSDQPSLDRAQQLTARLNNVSEPAVLNTRGWVKFKRGEFQESLPLLEQAVERSPQSPLMRYHLGMAQLRTGDRDAARTNLEAALTSGNAFHGMQEAKAALEEIERAG